MLRFLTLLTTGSSLRPGEVGAALGVSRATGHRLVSSMEVSGFAAVHSVTGFCMPGPRLFAVARAALDGLAVRRAARAPMQYLRGVSGETVELCILDGSDAVVVYTAESHRALRVVDQLGERMSAHLSAAGKAMIATLSRDELEALFPGPALVKPTAASIGSRIELDRELEHVRSVGFATNRGEGESEFVGIAAPVARMGGLASAITVVLPSERVDDDFEVALGRFVIETAAKVSIALDELSAVDRQRALMYGQGYGASEVNGPVGTANSATNVLEILGILAEHSVVRVSDVARQLAVAPSTAHRLLAMLQQHKFAYRDHRLKTYHAGPALLDIALRVGTAPTLSDRAEEYLDWLRGRTGETCAFWSQAGSEARVDRVLDGTARLRVVEEVGRRVPLTNSAAGLVMLAEMNDFEIQAVMGHAGTEPDSAASLRLRPLRERVGNDGTAVLRTAEGVVTVAAGCSSATSEPGRWAFTVSLPITRYEKHRAELHRDVAAAAERFAESLQ
ncbi:hypothetical protein CH300_05355 [Rhodococcus sp. 15-1154-1]|nr:hypothetical protein CH300_05355 [Rhodococcus sp. 15-1154-1]